mgnify:CR=1 FL=1
MRVSTQNFRDINEKGLGLVEVIVAMGVAMIIITAMISLAIFTLKATTQSKGLLEATRQANKQMEKLRAYRDNYVATSSWEDFYNYLIVGGAGYCSTNCSSGHVCYIDDNFAFHDAPNPNPAPTACFYAIPVSGNSNVLNIVTIAPWQIGGETKSAYSYSRLSNW